MTDINQQLKKRLDEIEYRQKLILGALRNLLTQNNPNGVNDYLANTIERSVK